ncbi:MAG: phosphotransferase family protein [Bryobacterales bacterium]|nr:phosphotransferase family protein [Chrysiogenetes bacterium]MCB9383278.1 phosphotransferase family protein [Bryobacterales bacterium]
MRDTAPIRPGEQLDLARLQRYLSGKIDGAEQGIELEQFPGGHSNLTYLLRTGGREYVLRRPPLGPVPPKAHDMAREFRVLDRVAPLFPPAPAVYLLCEDPGVAGATFYLMERRRGVILRREFPADWRGQANPEKIAHAFLDTLAQLHAVDIERHDLAALGRPEGFLERQVRGWSRRWEGSRTTELPVMDRLSAWLTTNLPVSPPATLVHNDYKLDNVMLDEADPGRVTAVLDWEMSSVGDPLVDLGIVLCYWPQAGDSAWRRNAISPLTTEPGWPSRADLLARYHRKTGRDLANIAYYEVFGIFKLAVVLQQIYYRFHVGQTRDERFRDFDKRVAGLAEAARQVMESA